MKDKNSSMDIMGFGALNMDQLHLVDKIAGADEESFVNGFTETCGGSAANTIIGGSRLNLKTGFIGKVAQDREGDILHNNLIHENIDDKCIITSPSGRSGRVMGFIDSQGERALYVEPGVNDTITLDEIDIKHVSKTKILHLSSFVGESFYAQEKLLDEISGIKISFDPGMIYAHKGIKSLEKILYSTNILLLNELELKILLKKDNFQDNSDLIKSLKTFTNYGIDTVVVKMGEKGAMAFDGSQSIFKPCFKVECRDTTGAGDSFNAGFLYGVIKKFSLEDACEFGNKVASRCVECIGATDGLPLIDDMSLEKYEKN